MKKYFLSLILGTSLLVAPTQKAEAGVLCLAMGVVGTIAGAAGSDEGAMAGLTGFAGGLVYGGIGYWIYTASSAAGWITTGKVFMVFDANAELPQEGLEEVLNISYPFINNQTVVRDLAFVLKSKYEFNKEEAMVSLDENETRSILSATDLNEQQIKTVVNGLK